MNKNRILRIKDPKLRKIRNNFRGLLHTIYTNRMSEIYNQKEVLQSFDAFWDDDTELNKELHEDYQELSKEESGLRYTLKASIIYCPVCGEINKDMIYRHSTQEWICTICNSKIV